MIFARQLNDAAGQTASPVIFVDPSGRRWQRSASSRLRLAALRWLGFWWPSPISTTHPLFRPLEERLGPPLTSDTTGKQLPVVGQGPLVRVLKVRRDDGQVLGLTRPQKGW